MPILTPNFSLPYPAPTDEPCEFAEQWCDFATRFNEVLDGFQTTVDRTYPTIPVAVMRVTTPTVVQSGEAIQFDTVEVNTAGWIDFDVSRSDITPTRGGYISYLADVFLTSPGTTSEVVISLNVAFSVSDQQKDRATGSFGLNLGATENPVTPGGFRRITLTRISGPGPITVQLASFSAWWHSDRSAP